MNLFAVSFFGHREVDDPFVIEQQLEAIVRELLHSKEYVEFLVSSNNFLRPDSSPFYCFFRNGSSMILVPISKIPHFLSKIPVFPAKN